MKQIDQEATLSLSVGLAVVALSRSRVAVAIKRIARPVRPVTGALHRAHSGHVGDYVAWVFVGTAALIVLLQVQL